MCCGPASNVTHAPPYLGLPNPLPATVTSYSGCASPHASTVLGMPQLVSKLRSLLVLLWLRLRQWRARGVLKHILLVWLRLKRFLLSAPVVGCCTPKDGKKLVTRTPKARCSGEKEAVTQEKASGEPVWQGHESGTVCESRRPSSALELYLDHPHAHFLQPGDIPTRPASMGIPGQSSSVHSSHDMLHPYSYTHSNGSKASNTSTDMLSTNDPSHVRGGHLGVAHPRPEGRPTSRAAARGISRVASRAPSRATSHSRASRGLSRSPAPSAIDLPIGVPPHSPGPPRPHTPSAPPSPARHTIGSRRSVVLAGDIAELSPDSLPSISLPVARETIYPTMTIPRYDNYATISPDPGDWTLAPVTTHFPM